MESKIITESSDRRFALLIDADNVSARYLKPILNELSKYGTVTIKRIYGDWTLTLHAKWKDALLENSITPIQQFGYTQGKNATDSAMIIDAMDILYTDNVDGFCLVSSDSDFTRLASRLRESGRMVIGMGEKKTPTPFRRACDVFTTLELLVQNKRSEKGGSGNAVPKDSVEQAVVDIITDNQNNGKATGLGEIGSRLQKRYPDFDVRSYGTNLLSKLLEEFTRVRITKDHSSVTVELAEGEERPERAEKLEKVERSGKVEKSERRGKAEKSENVSKTGEISKAEEESKTGEESKAEEGLGAAGASESGASPAEVTSELEGEVPQAEAEKPGKASRRSRSHRGTRRVATKATGQLSEGRRPVAPLPEAAEVSESGGAEATEMVEAVEAAGTVEGALVFEGAGVVGAASSATEGEKPATRDVSDAEQETSRGVSPGRRGRAERKTLQAKADEAATAAKGDKTAGKAADKAKANEAAVAAKADKTAGKAKADKTADKVAGKAAAVAKDSAKQVPAKRTAAKKATGKKAAGKKAAAENASPRKVELAGDTPAGYIRELVAGADAEGIMLSTITDAVRAKFKDFKVRDLGYSQMRQYMASVGDYDLEKSGRNFRVRLSR